MVGALKIYNFDHCQSKDSICDNRKTILETFPEGWYIK
jgi:hypothetical protein